MNLAHSIPRALTIAGSDSGGCAGIQADLKTFAALGVHGMSVITSVTAQDTQHVYMSSDLPLENIQRQIEVVIEDIGVDAVKTGMLSSAEIIELVTEKVKQFKIECLVVDPVMVSTGGDPLIRQEAVEVMKTELFPQALVVTPNLQEAEFLTGCNINEIKDLKEVIQTIFALGPRSVVVKGGHLGDPEHSTDYFFDGEELTPFSGPRFDTKNTHGSGCTFASAIASYLAHGLDLKNSVSRAKEFVTEAIRHSLPLGQGHGPLGHFWKQWGK
ncbi:bifunctional hydroxymethylpyrimidine kinase/phosphomethylpyrimidine kinase [Acidobacteria bacterium AH-259-D05]|nr:bifunctional hydroxymethylpyrimidine kinase/phosphomethylpyrimidine kinase [Acidobacteria bacterium AH-259-D05]